MLEVVVVVLASSFGRLVARLANSAACFSRCRRRLADFEEPVVCAEAGPVPTPAPVVVEEVVEVPLTRVPEWAASAAECDVGFRMAGAEPYHLRP